MNQFDEYSRQHAQLQWNTTPCGMPEDSSDDTSIEYFDKVEHERYITDSWILRVAPFAGCAGKKFLEIGCGHGTDLLQFARNGAVCHAIDITDRHMELTRRNFSLHNFSVDVRACGATKICHDDNTFDLVYSVGVIHHISDGEKVFDEVHRVLKPGGRFFVALYYKHSAYHYFSKILSDGILGRKLKILGYDGLLSTIESGADGATIKPFVKLYTKKQLGTLLQHAGFCKPKIGITHLQKQHYGRFQKIFGSPVFTSPFFERRLGWYVYANVVKHG